MAGSEIVVGVSGASGGLLARRFVELALAAEGLARLHLVLSPSSLRVARSELDPEIGSAADWVRRLSASGAAAAKLVLHSNEDVGASIASGSYPTSGMIVIPCSAGTLGAIANWISRGLLQRAADVCLKERRPLVLALRESPYSLVHIENMRRATLLPAPSSLPRRRRFIFRPRRWSDSWTPIAFERRAGWDSSCPALRIAGREKRNLLNPRDDEPLG